MTAGGRNSRDTAKAAAATGTAAPTLEQLRTRFDSYTRRPNPADPSAANACWTWRGPSCRGCPLLRMQDRTYYATRFSWLLSRGAEAPATHNVERACFNSQCVRPDHLVLRSRVAAPPPTRTAAALPKVYPVSKMLARALLVYERLGDAWMPAREYWFFGTTKEQVVAREQDHLRAHPEQAAALQAMIAGGPDGNLRAQARWVRNG